MPQNAHWDNAEGAEAAYLLYRRNYFPNEAAATIDRVLNTISPLLYKGENAINQILTELAGLNPGELDQSRLMAAQMNMSRWQLAAQLLSNFASGIATGLKNTVQNVGR